MNGNLFLRLLQLFHLNKRDAIKIPFLGAQLSGKHLRRNGILITNYNGEKLRKSCSKRKVYLRISIGNGSL